MAQPHVALPRLETGDRMSRAEFHRRYELRHDIRAELIEGVVYVASPIRFDLHDEQAEFIRTWVGLYRFKHAEVRAGSDATLILDEENEVEPDAFLFRPGEGGPWIDEHHYLNGAPQLVVEVAASSLSYDLGAKMRIYLKHGVREYLVWRVEQGAIDWFELVGDEYVRREPDEEGIIESVQFPGLRLDVRAMIAMDGARVLAALR